MINNSMIIGNRGLQYFDNYTEPQKKHCGCCGADVDGDSEPIAVKHKGSTCGAFMMDVCVLCLDDIRSDRNPLFEESNRLNVKP